MHWNSLLRMARKTFFSTIGLKLSLPPPPKKRRWPRKEHKQPRKETKAASSADIRKGWWAEVKERRMDRRARMMIHSLPLVQEENQASNPLQEKSAQTGIKFPIPFPFHLLLLARPIAAGQGFALPSFSLPPTRSYITGFFLLSWIKLRGGTNRLFSFYRSRNCTHVQTNLESPLILKIFSENVKQAVFAAIRQRRMR